MTWCTYLKSSRKYIKREGQTDGQRDRQTDGGRCNISRHGIYLKPYVHLSMCLMFQYIASPNYLLLCGHVGY